MKYEAGFSTLIIALKNHANSEAMRKERKHYLADYKPLMKDAWRISKSSLDNFWHGYIYTKNDSAVALEEELTTTVSGMEIVWPPNTKSGEPVSVNIPPGEDHIVVMRRIEGECSMNYGFSFH